MDYLLRKKGFRFTHKRNANYRRVEDERKVETSIMHQRRRKKFAFATTVLHDKITVASTLT